MDIILAIAGLAALLIGGDLLVRGAVALSLRLGISALIVGLTVVACGTSAPEMLIGIKAALEGAPGIAVGNVVGSNIANILLVLGIPAMISTVQASGGGCNRSYFQMVGASALLIVLCALGPLHFWHAAVLLGLFALMLADMIRSARNSPNEETDPSVEQAASEQMSVPRIVIYLLAGLIGLPLGANLLIDGATGLARHMGISEAVIGLTMVAIGTSLPELATTVMASLRKQADVAIGNVLGSNLFNILSILGVTSLFGPIAIEPEFLSRDLWVMLASAIILGPFVVRNITINRVHGAVFLGLYAVYLYILLNSQGGHLA
jgi:cation:H+ antiporter